MSTGLKFLSSVISNGAGSALLKLDPKYLVDAQENAAYDFIKSYYKRYREVPTPAIVRDQTQVRLPNVDGTLKFHMDNLYERHDFEIYRETWQGFRNAMQTGKPAPVTTLLEQSLRRVRRSGRGSHMIDAHQAIGLVTERLIRAQIDGGISGVPSPWPYYNDQTGGNQPADLITIVGRSGMGKTAMALAQAEFAYDAGYSALVVTSEMGAEQISRRWMAMKFGLNPENLKKGTISTHLLRRMEQMQATLLGRERFRILSLGTGARLGLVEAAIEEMQPDIVYIDGIYLFRPNSMSNNMKQSERVTAVFDELKQQCIDTNLPHVVTTQFNRTAGKGGKDGSLENIGLSDSIGWHSSIVLAVRPGPTENIRDSREMEFLKGREGEEGKFAINFKFRPVDFSQLSREELDSLSGRQQINVDHEWD